MKAKFYAIATIGLLFHLQVIKAQTNSQASLPVNVSSSWYEEAINNLKLIELNFKDAGKNVFTVSNPAQHIAFSVDEKGYVVRSIKTVNDKDDWNARFTLNSIGRDKPAFLFPSGNYAIKRGNKLLQVFGFTDVEYCNDKNGLRQNFIIHEKILGNGDLRVKIELQSALNVRVINGTSIGLYSDNCELTYEDLKVWDANNKILPSYMEWNNETHVISLVIDDKDAAYPVTVDPLNKSPEWTTSANGVLPSLLSTINLQALSLYGFSVVGLGDINGDAFDDVAIGAPGMADLITGDGSLLGTGAVFIYLGDTTGLHTMPDKVLQPNTAVAGAAFGFNIAAGDITGDGINDIIISAPLDHYITKAQGLFGPANATVHAGKVYMYNSESLFSSPNPSPFLQIRLEGSTYFSSGVAGLLLSNINVNALFGFSLAVTDDLNGDNKKDIVIGCPAYVGTNLLAVQSGAAFIFYSDSLSTNTPVKLDVPTSTLLGLPGLPAANLGGLLFGFSVDGAGDFNNDGYRDVIIGAPAGMNLSSLGGIFTGQILGGSAYIYYGNGSGVNTTAGVRLQAAPSGLLSNFANLFGYKVKGVTNSANQRNGNILVSAVAGSVLSNIVSGLKLKAGEVHLFKKRSGAFGGSITSDQVLSSPRATSVLSLLTGQNLNISMLYGASMDNILDINCDGNADIIIGEPLSTNVPLIGANVTGGAAYIYLGKPDGTYNSAPSWSMYPEVSSLLGVNATSLVGFSVAGAGHTNGMSQRSRVLVGGPANTLDFGVGLLDLGNTVGTLYSYVFDNNGLGKGYTFDANLCSFLTLPTTLVSFSAQPVNHDVLLNWVSQSEDNMNFYELQRSMDKTHFETISVVFAKGAADNKYSYLDKTATADIIYYRLRMVDKSAKSTYSSVITVRFGNKQESNIVVAPNPVTNDVVQLLMTGMDKGMYRIQLFSTSGVLQATKTIAITQTYQNETLDLKGNIPGGVYWLEIFDQQNTTRKTIKVFVDKK